MVLVRILVLGVCLLAPSAANAEAFRGTVKDESGGAVAGATVTVLTARQAVVATTVSDAAGSFTIAELRPGEYVVHVDAPGFGQQRVAATVVANAPPLSIVLTVDAVKETVTVTSEPGVAQDAARSLQPVSVISSDELTQRVHTVVAEAVAEEPGVHLQRTSSSMAGIFVRGLTGNKVNVYVDGVRYSNGAQRGGVNTFLNLIDQAAIDGIEVVHGPNSAQYGSDALGGTVQFLTKTPALAASGTTLGGEISASGTTTYQGGGGNAALSWGTTTFGLFAGGGGRKVGELRPGGGIDSHAAVTRFLGIPSTLVMDSRLPNTGFNQLNGMVKANWTPSARTQFVANYTATRQDQAHRYDQELGGDGNLIAELNDLTLDLFYARLERSGIGWFDHAAVTYSINSQREERVNQGGQGSNTAAIAHEPERTTANAIQGALNKSMTRSNVQVGGDAQFESLVSDAFNINPVSGARTVRRPRVPSHASFLQGGVFAQMGYDAITDRLRLVGAVRVGHARYEANAADAPLSGSRPLWPDDRFSTTSVTFRTGAVLTPSDKWTFVTSVSRGFRAPHMTDLGTLGITGAGFEIASRDVEGRGALVGTTAGADAVSSGNPVAQLVPESSLNVDGILRFRTRRASAELTVFVNHIYDNIQKQALILPQGAVGSLLGTDPITSQNANGVVFVAAATTPVLVRANVDNARSWGVEHQGRYNLAGGLSLRTVFTYYNVKDTRTKQAPNIEGGIPAPDGYLILQYAPAGGKWWVQPYLHAAAEQSNLSSLDLGDRRTAGPRSRSSIQAFFRNGATNRGWVSSGPDGAFGNADDILIATGETLAQVQDRVLGAGVNSGVLFSAVPGYVTAGVRAGLKLGKHELMIDAENLNDKNYRGISWGIDAPGRGVTVRYVARF